MVRIKKKKKITKIKWGNGITAKKNRENYEKTANFGSLYHENLKTTTKTKKSIAKIKILPRIFQFVLSKTLNYQDFFK